MKNKTAKTILKRLGIFGLLFAISLAVTTTAFGFTLNVVDHNGAPIANGFSWLLEEDNTTLTVVPPSGIATSQTKSASLDIHKSYAPVAASGSTAGATATIAVPDTNGRYILSVLPYTGYTLGGTTISGDPANAVEVVVHAQPIPTAQISILIFQDHAPINNVPDDGEAGLAGAVVTLHDSGGQQMADGLGNPLGTTYLPGTTTIDVMGNGTITSDANGEVLIKNLAPGKYGVVVSPPPVTAPGQWIQTSTIEGTSTVDAWVKADEPAQFIEGFGAGFYHVFIGFVNPNDLAGFAAGGTGKITGNLRYNHFARPPANQGLHIGPPVKDCWIGINDPVTGQGLYAAACFDGMTPTDINVGDPAIFPEPGIDTDHNGNGIFDGPMEVPSSFSIPNVPAGTYELVTWDKPLDALFGISTVTVPGDTLASGDQVNLGTILSFRWFGSFIGSVFLDSNENGIKDVGEVGLPEQNINIRFRDGTIYQAQPTDINGEYFLEEVFPFFKWLVPEVDFARFKSTGMTTAVDYGGAIAGGFDENNPWPLPTFDQLNPQPQAIDNPLTGNNLSRTETGEVLTQAMHLFLNQTNVIDWGKMTYNDNENGGITGVVMYAVTRAENDPRFAAGEPWEPGIPRVQMNLYQDSDSNGVIDDLNLDNAVTLADVDNYPLDNFPGSEDIDRNGNGAFDAGDAISITTTDSWDDNLPADCIQDLPNVHGSPIPECADAFGTWNQVRPGVFDGGYAFASYYPGGIESGSNEVSGLPAANYIVEATTPPGYLLLKEEDKNVDFGNELLPSTQLLAPVCVGEPHLVPALLSFQTDDNLAPLPGLNLADLVASPFANETRPSCDRKKIGLNAKENAAADFFFFTKVPKAARAVGFVNNDLSAEFNQGSPNFGEKAAPSWIPVSFKDWKGNEITRVYTDEFGGYNAMLPSTFTVNAAAPSGVSPNIITLVLNDPFLPDGSPDPHHNPDYSVTPWTVQYEAGRTSYLDTPIVPVASFVNFPQGTLDIEPTDGTPVISQIVGPETASPQANFGPLICSDFANDGVVTITSAGLTSVPNPEYAEGNPVNPVTIDRDFGFGSSQGQVLLDGDASKITINSWSAGQIEITVGPSAASGTITVVRGDNGVASESGMTLVITDCAAATFVSAGAVYPATPIQDAVDAATAGGMILVGPGTYEENVIMYKPVHLQGAGTGITKILAAPNPSERLAAWHAKVRSLLGTPGVDPFTANEGPGIMAMGAAVGHDFNITTPGKAAIIDGFTINGAISGGGIMVDSKVHDLQITNNEIRNNQGVFAGGIIIGAPDTGLDADNDNIIIRGNRIVKNGGIQGAGGIAIYTGATDYLVDNNLIAGNFSRFSGGGMAHVGLSENGTISNNRILFNEIFYGLLLAGAGDGGGLYLAGELIGGEGAGDLTVNANLIQGNLAGSGDGGGIMTHAYNGTDAASTAHILTITNNIIANNLAGHAGGGIYLHDTASAKIVNNTIVHNDTTATSSLSFAPGASASTPQPAGLVAEAYSTSLAANTTPEAFPHPLLQNNILWHNRSFFSDSTRNNSSGDLVFDSYWDLAVINTAGAADQMDISYSVLSSLAGPNGEDYTSANNDTSDPLFIHSYTNTLFSAAVLDEGGNAISVRFTPLKVSSMDYHLTDCSPAKDTGVTNPNIPAADYDGDTRPNGAVIDIGADEYVASQGNYTQLTLLSPIGGEIIDAGSSYNITWGAPNTGITAFELYYSLDNGANWLLIDTTADATVRCYLWTLPQTIAANDQLLVRVVAVNGSTVIDTVNSGGGITLDIEALIAPNGGETLFYDAAASPLNTFTIEWQNPYTVDANDTIALRYRLQESDSWSLITNTITGDATSYSWQLPPVTTLYDEVRVQLIISSDTGFNRLIDMSATTFSLQPAPAIPPADLPTVPAEDPVGGGTTPPTTGAGINFQCPDNSGGQANVHDNGVVDGIYRAEDGEIDNPLKPQQVCLHLAAGDGYTMMADGYPLYMFGFSNVTGVADDAVMNMWNNPTAPGAMLGTNFPAPLLKFKEGDDVYLTLSNVGMMMRPDLFDPHTVHWHGFPNAASVFDGVPEASIAINMGSSLTYYYKVVEPGTFMYHCHVEATEHMQMGMLGNLYVTPAQDGTLIGGFTKFAYNDGDGTTGYGKELHLQIAAFDPDFHDASENVQPLPFALMDDRYPMFNGRGYPDTVNPANILNAEGYASQRDTSKVTASAATDKRILLRLSSLSTTSFHTVTVLGIPMQVIGKGSRKLANNQYYNTNSVTLGGGQSVDVLLDITGVNPGTYFLYVTNLDHLANHGEDYGGMMTEIVVQ